MSPSWRYTLTSELPVVDSKLVNPQLVMKLCIFGGDDVNLIPLCGPCETNALSQEETYSKGAVRRTNFAAMLRQRGPIYKGDL
jgi:hypothetical protein